jgi:hypothetical protein
VGVGEKVSSSIEACCTSYAPAASRRARTASLKGREERVRASCLRAREAVSTAPQGDTKLHRLTSSFVVKRLWRPNPAAKSKAIETR